MRVSDLPHEVNVLIEKNGNLQSDFNGLYMDTGSQTLFKHTYMLKVSHVNSKKTTGWINQSPRSFLSDMKRKGHKDVRLFKTETKKL